MIRKLRLRIIMGSALVLAFVYVVTNPGHLLKPDLQDNLIAESLGAIVTLLIVDLVFEASAEREERRALAEYRRSLVQTLDADLHALWALLIPEPLARDDPLRGAPREDRLRRFLQEISDAGTWSNAPSAHAKVVRARVRDLGEDAERLLVLSENVTDFSLRARLDALRRACRALDEAWDSTPRSELAARFAQTIAPEVDAVLRRIDAQVGHATD